MKKSPLLITTALAAIVAIAASPLPAPAQTQPQATTKSPDEDALSALSHISTTQSTPSQAAPTQATPIAILPQGATPSPLAPPAQRPAFATPNQSADAPRLQIPAPQFQAAQPQWTQPQGNPHSVAQIQGDQISGSPNIGSPQTAADAAPPGVNQSGGVPIIAQTSDPFATHVPELPPILRVFEQNGVRITSLGGEGGLRGYLLEEPAGRMQVVYLTPDGKSLVVGVMQTISNDGKHLENVTMLQFAEMRQRFEAAHRAIDEQKRAADEARRHADEATSTLEQQQNRITEASQQFNAPVLGQGAAVPSKPPATPQVAPQVAPAVPPQGGDQATPVPPRTTSMLPRQSENIQNGANGGEVARAGQAYLTNVSSEKFVSEVEKTAYFPVGREGAPTLYMLADPQCPHCHATWKYLKPLVAQGKVLVKVILVDALPGSGPVALSLISQPNPGRAWWNGEGSETGHPVTPGASNGTQAERNGEKYLGINMQFLSAHKIEGTPWLGYVGNDGKVYEMEGDQNLPEFLSNMKGME